MDTKKGEWPLGETTSKKAPKLSLVDGSTDIGYKDLERAKKEPQRAQKKLVRKSKLFLRLL